MPLVFASRPLRERTGVRYRPEHILYILNRGYIVYIPPLPGKEAMPRLGQPMPSLWPVPTNVPLGVAALGRAGDESAQSGENPEAYPSRCPPLGICWTTASLSCPLLRPGINIALLRCKPCVRFIL